MSQRTEADKLSMVAGEAIAQHLRVDVDASGNAVIAGDELSIGTMDTVNCQSGDRCAVHLKNAPGTKLYIAGGAISIGDSVTSAAAGKVVTGTAGAEDLGKALTASGGDGDWIEVAQNQ